MTKREIIRLVLEGGEPPYVPWQLGFTLEAQEKLQAHFGTADLEPVLQNHLLPLGSGDRLIEARFHPAKRHVRQGVRLHSRQHPLAALGAPHGTSALRALPEMRRHLSPSGVGGSGLFDLFMLKVLHDSSPGKKSESAGSSFASASSSRRA